MDLARRKFLRLTACVAALLALSNIAWAQAYPSRPVRIIAGYPAGGIVDVFARLIGQCLSERFGQTFIIENKPGAAGNLATAAVVKANPDGYTLLMIGNSNTINSTFYENLNFNFLTDIAPVASLYRDGTNVLVVNPSFPAKTLSEFIAYAKTNPGKINFGSPGVGQPCAYRGGAIQADGGYRPRPRAIPRPTPGADRSVRWSIAGRLGAARHRD
jgi:tripartite-type tricarboxylate transporter receptor subunit TctC